MLRAVWPMEAKRLVSERRRSAGATAALRKGRAWFADDARQRDKTRLRLIVWCLYGSTAKVMRLLTRSEIAPARRG
jgi:hypothetical protein